MNVLISHNYLLWLTKYVKYVACFNMPHYYKIEIRFCLKITLAYASIDFYSSS